MRGDWPSCAGCTGAPPWPGTERARTTTSTHSQGQRLAAVAHNADPTQQARATVTIAPQKARVSAIGSCCGRLHLPAHSPQPIALAPIMTIVWRPNMAIGDATVDADHQHLIGLINAVELTLQAAGGRGELTAILDQLAAYTKEHFDREEGLMRRTGYGGLEHHREAHRDLRLRFGTIRSTIEATSVDSVPAQEIQGLVVVLRHWLLDHVFKEDMKLKAFLKGPG